MLLLLLCYCLIASQRRNLNLPQAHRSLRQEVKGGIAVSELLSVEMTDLEDEWLLQYSGPGSKLVATGGMTAL